MFFGSAKVGKAYVSFHLLPLYMNAALSKAVSPALKTRMHGKSCFNFTTDPDKATVGELKKLTAAAIREWASKNWL